MQNVVKRYRSELPTIDRNSTDTDYDAVQFAIDLDGLSEAQETVSIEGASNRSATTSPCVWGRQPQITVQTHAQAQAQLISYQSAFESPVIFQQELDGIPDSQLLETEHSVEPAALECPELQVCVRREMGADERWELQNGMVQTESCGNDQHADWDVHSGAFFEYSHNYASERSPAAPCSSRAPSAVSGCSPSKMFGVDSVTDRKRKRNVQEQNYWEDVCATLQQNVHTPSPEQTITVCVNTNTLTLPLSPYCARRTKTRSRSAPDDPWDGCAGDQECMLGDVAAGQIPEGDLAAELHNILHHNEPDHNTSFECEIDRSMGIDNDFQPSHTGVITLRGTHLFRTPIHVNRTMMQGATAIGQCDRKYIIVKVCQISMCCSVSLYARVTGAERPFASS
jgi:hypothetical protein